MTTYDSTAGKTPPERVALTGMVQQVQADGFTFNADHFGDLGGEGLPEYHETTLYTVHAPRPALEALAAHLRSSPDGVYDYFEIEGTRAEGNFSAERITDISSPSADVLVWAQGNEQQRGLNAQAAERTLVAEEWELKEPAGLAAARQQEQPHPTFVLRRSESGDTPLTLYPQGQEPPPWSDEEYAWDDRYWATMRSHAERERDVADEFEAFDEQALDLAPVRCLARESVHPGRRRRHTELE